VAPLGRIHIRGLDRVAGGPKIFYCRKYQCRIERVDGDRGTTPDGKVHPCFTRERGPNEWCHSLTVLSGVP